MTGKLLKFSKRYQTALGEHLKRGLRASLRRAHELGIEAAAIGLEPLTLARIHERSLRSLVLPGGTPADALEMVRRAAKYFAEAITPMEKTHRGALEANAHLGRVVESLRRRSSDLSTANSELKKEIVQRKTAEKSLRKSQQHYAELLKQSHQMQEELRFLSHQILSAQEEERKKISRELHDQIGQVLTAINAELATLKMDATADTKELRRRITSTQRLVEKSVELVHRFARELRPAVLDDLGLIPALHAFMKAFAKRQGIRAKLAAFAGVEQLDNARRTVLYRVAQEALTNVARHAEASLVEVTIEELKKDVCLKIRDNGKSFQADRVMRSSLNKRLGLLGMRERVEMVGGTFDVKSARGKGTTIVVCIPFSKSEPKKRSRPAG
jgi:signal transduction histidine kinase